MTMKNKDLIRTLSGMKVETGSLVCFGCGHEHNCSVHGCAIINEAITSLQNIETARQITREYLEHYRSSIPRKAFIEVMKLFAGEVQECSEKEAESHGKE